eukprot:2325688-Amphidinium_carterae.1
MDMDDYFADRRGGWDFEGWPMTYALLVEAESSTKAVSAVPEQADDMQVTAESRKQQGDGKDDESMSEERFMTLTLYEIQWDQSMTEGGIEGAQIGSWCAWSPDVQGSFGRRVLNGAKRASSVAVGGVSNGQAKRAASSIEEVEAVAPESLKGGLFELKGEGWSCRASIDPGRADGTAGSPMDTG